MNTRRKIGIGAIGPVALGGSTLTVGMASAMASTPGVAVAHSATVPSGNEVDQTGGAGPNVQLGSQSGVADAAVNTSEVASNEANLTLEGVSETDAPGGTQSTGGANVGSQVGGAQ